MSQVETYDEVQCSTFGKLELQSNFASDQLQNNIDLYKQYKKNLIQIKQEMKRIEDGMRCLLLQQSFVDLTSIVNGNEGADQMPLKPQEDKWRFLYYKPSQKSDNNKYIVFAIELKSGFIVVEPMIDISGKTLANFICKIYHSYNVKEIIVHDDNLHDSIYIKNICKILNITKKIQNHHCLQEHQTRFMTILNDIRRQDLSVKWGDCLPMAMDQYNRTA